MDVITYNLVRKSAISVRISISERLMSSKPGISNNTILRPITIKGSEDLTSEVQLRKRCSTLRAEGLKVFMNYIGYGVQKRKNE